MNHKKELLRSLWVNPKSHNSKPQSLLQTCGPKRPPRALSPTSLGFKVRGLSFSFFCCAVVWGFRAYRGLGFRAEVGV